MGLKKPDINYEKVFLGKESQTLKTRAHPSSRINQKCFGRKTFIFLITSNGLIQQKVLLVLRLMLNKNEKNPTYLLIGQLLNISPQ